MGAKEGEGGPLGRAKGKGEGPLWGRGKRAGNRGRAKGRDRPSEEGYTGKGRVFAPRGRGEGKGMGRERA